VKYVGKGLFASFVSLTAPVTALPSLFAYRILPSCSLSYPEDKENSFLRNISEDFN
jgi:hypothetical protein